MGRVITSNVTPAARVGQIGLGQAPVVDAGGAFGAPAMNPAAFQNAGGDVAGFAAGTQLAPELIGQRVVLRPLAAADFEHYRDALARNADALGATGVGPETAVLGDVAFEELLEQQDLTRLLDISHHFGVFADDTLIGEVSLEGVVRGHVQSAYVTAWIDEAHAGERFATEAYVLLVRHAFDDLGLHRVEAAVLPDNEPVRHSLETLGIRSEGISPRFLEVDGEWRDHERFALTAEEWEERRDALLSAWTD